MKNRMRLLSTYLVVVFAVFLLCGAVNVPRNLSSLGIELRRAGDTLKDDDSGGNAVSGQSTPQVTALLSANAQGIKGESGESYKMYPFMDVDSGYFLALEKPESSSPYSLSLSSWIKIFDTSKIKALRLKFKISLIGNNSLTPRLKSNFAHDIFFDAASNTSGNGEDESLFIPDTFNIHQEKTSNFVVHTDSISVLDSQTASLTLAGTVDSLKSGQDLFINFGGIVVILEEVIDPEFTVVFSLDSVEIKLNQGDTDYISILEDSITIQTSVPTVSFRSDKVSFVYREFFIQKFIPSPTAVLGNIPAFRVFKTNSTHPGLIHLDQFEERLAANDKAHGSIGFVSNCFKPGLIPLYQGKLNTIPTRNQQIGDLATFTYSLCLDEIVNDPNYSPDKILCFVIPPKEDYSPCAY